MQQLFLKKHEDRRLRAGQVVRRPGYDGAYGVIELLSPAEREDLKGQVSLFGAEAPKAAKTARGRVAKPARSGRPPPGD